FELGPIYFDDTPKGQALVAAGLRVGRTGPKHWRKAARAVDLYDVKADAQAALAAMGVPAESLQSAADPPPWYHPGRAASLRRGPKLFGHFGEPHPALLEALEVRLPFAGFEVFLDRVPEPRAVAAAPPELSVFQPIERDFAFVVDRDLPAEALLRAARGAARGVD